MKQFNAVANVNGKKIPMVIQERTKSDAIKTAKRRYKSIGDFKGLKVKEDK